MRKSMASKNRCPANVDLYSGFVYDALDIPTTIATPLFATARLSGWCAHRIEELISGGKLMRPAYKSVQQPRALCTDQQAGFCYVDPCRKTGKA